jgi:hypothetical protein
MKKLLIIGVLLAVCLSPLALRGDTIIVCPDGNALDMNIFAELVPPDFPPELFTIFCTIPFAQTPMAKYPQVLIGLASESGTSQDSVIITFFLDMSTRKYIAFVEYNQTQKRYIVLWVSKHAPDGLEKYIYDIVNEINNTESF